MSSDSVSKLLQEDTLEAGRLHLAEGSYIEALRLFNTLLSKEPQNLPGLFCAGLAFYKLLNYESALKCFTKSLELQPGNIPALAVRSLVYEQISESNLAIAGWLQATQLPATTWQDWQYKGTAFFELDNLQRALECDERAIALNPNAYEPYLYKGIVQSILGQSSGFCKSFNKAIALNPNAYDPHLYKGISLSHIERFNQALESFNRAITLRPENYKAYLYRAITLSHMHEIDNAMESFAQALDLEPGDYRNWFYRGIGLHNNNQLEDALESYDRAILLDFSRAKIWEKRKHCISDLIKQGKNEPVAQSWKKIIDLKETNAECWIEYGSILMKVRELKGAIKCYDKAIELDPEQEEAWNEKGRALSHQGQYEKALECLGKATDIAPDYAEAWFNTGRVFTQLKETEAAEESYKFATESDPDYVDAWYERGKALNSLGRRREALDSYERTIELDHKSFYAWNAKGNILSNLGEPHFLEAIKSYKCSLKFSENQFWRAWKNLGRIYEADSYSTALQVWNNGLDSLRESSETYREGCGALHHMKAKLYYELGLKQGNIEFWRKSKESYNAALVFLEGQKYLREYYLEVLLEFIIVRLGLREKDEATELRRIASNMLNRLLQDETPSRKKKLSLKFSDLEQLTVNASVQSNQLVKAIEIAEKCKNVCMTWLLSGWNDAVYSCDWHDMVGFTEDNTAIIYWHLSPAAITTFVVKSSYSEPILVETNSENFFESGQRLRRFEKWAHRWNGQYENYREGSSHKQVARKKSWREQLPQSIQELYEILNISTILQHVGDADYLILIPHRDLHRFPLHALFPEDIPTSYLPSIQAGINTASQEFVLSGKMLSVENPDSQDLAELLYADVESAAITWSMNELSPERIANQAANKKNVVKALNGKHTFLHFTGHGTYEFDQPEQSALALSGRDKLSLREILDISFNNYSLVTLSACETAITGKRAITEEYVGLVSAFLYQRISYIVSTLWTVSENSSTLFMVYFYRQLKKDKTPKEALSVSASWLRTLTYTKLERLYSLIFEKLPRDEGVIRPFVRQQLSRICNMTIDEKRKTPFEHPYYWAAFIITGR